MAKIKILPRVLPYFLVFGFMTIDLFPILFPEAPSALLVTIKGTLFGLAALWILWRSVVNKAGMPSIGFEKGIILFSTAILLSTIFSPEPRMAWPVLASMLRFVLIFYLLLDVMDNLVDHEAMFTALLTLSLLILAAAALETYTMYLGWWNSTSTSSLPPFPYRFKSLLLYSNVCMAYANLLVPLVLITFLQTKRRVHRLITAAWLSLYVICLPFSSSRIGWLGAATSIGILVLYYVIQKNWHKRLIGLSLWTRIILVIAALFLVALAAFAGLVFLRTFASHPSHGNNIFGGRSEIWNNAWQIFLAHPLFGTGPGMTAYEVFPFTSSLPPQFWAFHAHSLYLQELAEFGLIGFAGFMVFLWMFASQLWRAFRKASPENKLLLLGVIAGIAAYVVHSVTDVITIFASLMDQIALLLAWSFTLKKPLPRRKHGTFGITFLLLLTLSGWFIWDTWSSHPMQSAANAADQDDWKTAAEYTAEAVNRDPDFRYNRDMHALALAWSFTESNNTDDLLKAASFLHYTTINEDSPAQWVADLAVTEWQAGNLQAGLQYITQAIERAPAEGTFYLNWAAMLDESGDEEAASAAYCEALQIRPEWAGHPFWSLTSARKLTMQQCRVPKTDTQPWWQFAQRSIQQGNLTEAALHLARSDWSNESKLARGITRGMLLEAQGRPDEALTEWQSALQNATPINLLTGNRFADVYSSIAARPALPTDLVPGYLQLQQDAGQFEIMEKMMEIYQANGEDALLIWVERVYQAAVSGQVGVYRQPE